MESMALGLQANLLVQFAPPEVADAFCASRLDGDWGYENGHTVRCFGLRPFAPARPAAVDRGTRKRSNASEILASGLDGWQVEQRECPTPFERSDMISSYRLASLSSRARHASPNSE